jgi:hypothetical protein
MQRYNLRSSTKIKSLISKLRITEAQAKTVYESVGDMPVRASQNRATHDFEMCWYGRWAKAEIKVSSNSIYMPPAGLIRDIPNVHTMHNAF